MNFLVIGGDAAGMSAASRAKRNAPDMNVTVLEQTQDVSYSACGMPYNIADPAREMADLVVRRAEVFRKKQGIDLRTGHRAVRIDRQKRQVIGVTQNGDEFRVDYDKLLIAAGGRPILPELPGFDLPGVVALKSLEDGRNIKALLNEKTTRRVVIIGMGYIALEMCEALRDRDIRVDMVKPRSLLLPWMHEDMAETVRKELTDHGVNLYPGHDVLRIEKTGSDLKVVCPDLELTGQLVLVAIGLRPNSELAGEAGLELSVDKAIAVNRRMQTSDPDILAAGDCADAFHVVTGQKTWIPLALRANRAGWAAADHVCGHPVDLEGVAGTAVFKVFGLEVARTGLTSREASRYGFDPVETLIQSRSRAHAHPGAGIIQALMVGNKKSGRLLGAQLVGPEGAAHRINAAAVALHNQMTVERFSQCDLAYAPPFGPVWDPLLTAANQLLKNM